MAAVLADVLDADHVTLELRAQTRDAALREIVMTMASHEELEDAEKFLAEVVAREEAHTTFMGHGVAIPHARSELVTQIVLGIGRSAEGIPFGGEGERAQLIFVIGVPRRMINDYLVCVGALARMTRNEETRAALMKAATAAEFLELLRAGSLLLE